MLKIRFQRIGRRKSPFFRIVVAQKEKAVKSKFIEILGHFNPHTKVIVLKKERIEYWICKGACPTDKAARIFTKNDIDCSKFIEKRVMKPTKAEREAAENKKKEIAEQKKVAKKTAEDKPKEEKSTEDKVKEEKPVEKNEKQSEKKEEDKENTKSDQDKKE